MATESRDAAALDGRREFHRLCHGSLNAGNPDVGKMASGIVGWMTIFNESEILLGTAGREKKKPPERMAAAAWWRD
jgi:hypothetical protein